MCRVRRASNAVANHMLQQSKHFDQLDQSTASNRTRRMGYASGQASLAEQHLDLELSRRTVQLSETSSCWLLSFIEGLRSHGHLAALLTRDLRLMFQGDKLVRWATTSGHEGEVLLGGKDPLPVWQQILEAIFMLRHPSAQRKGQSFQESVRPAQGMGLMGRAEELNAYMALLNGAVAVRAVRQLTPRIGLVPRDLHAFFCPEPAPAIVQVFAAQVVFRTEPYTGICHCIAVDAMHPGRVSAAVQPKACVEAKHWEMRTYDQLYLGEGSYTVNSGVRSKQLPHCIIDGFECACDGILRFSVEGLCCDSG